MLDRSGCLAQECPSFTGPSSSGAAAGPERGEAPVPRDLALLPVHHQAGEREWPGPEAVGVGNHLQGAAAHTTELEKKVLGG